MLPFPKTSRQYYQSWRKENEASLELAERKLLSFEVNLNGEGDSDKPFARLFRVPIPDYDGYMNTLELGNENSKSAEHAIVLVHGVSCFPFARPVANHVVVRCWSCTVQQEPTCSRRTCLGRYASPSPRPVRHGSKLSDPLSCRCKDKEGTR